MENESQKPYVYARIIGGRRLGRSLMMASLAAGIAIVGPTRGERDAKDEPLSSEPEPEPLPLFENTPPNRTARRSARKPR